MKKLFNRTTVLVLFAVLICGVLYSCDDHTSSKNTLPTASGLQGIEAKDYSVVDIKQIAGDDLLEETSFFDFQYKEKEDFIEPVDIEINGMWYKLEYQYTTRLYRNYTYIDDKINVECCISPYNNTVFFLDIKGENPIVNNVFSDFNTEEEYLEWVETIAEFFGMPELSSYEKYNCYTNYYAIGSDYGESTRIIRANEFLSNLGENLDSYIFVFNRADIGDIQTDCCFAVSVGVDHFQMRSDGYAWLDYSKLDSLEVHLAAERYISERFDEGAVIEFEYMYEYSRLTHYKGRLCCIYYVVAHFEYYHHNHYELLIFLE